MSGDRPEDGEEEKRGFVWGITPRGARPEPDESPETDDTVPTPRATFDFDALIADRGRGSAEPPPEAHEVDTAPVASYDLPTQAFSREDMDAQDAEDEASVPPAEPVLPLPIPARSTAAGPTQPPVDDEGAEWNEISAMFGGAQPVEVDDEPILAPVAGTAQDVYRTVAERVGPTARAVADRVPGAARAVADRVPTGGGRATRVLLIVAGAIALAIVAIVLFALGRQAGLAQTAAPAHSSTPTAVSTTPSAPPTTSSPSPSGTGNPKPLVPGNYAWNELHGGECIEPFGTAWDETFDVIPCDQPHTAQLVLVAPFPSETGAYPGDATITKQVGKLCTRDEVFALTRAKRYSDLQVDAAYPVSQEQWDNGDHNYYCFASRDSGDPMSISIRGTGPKS